MKRFLPSTQFWQPARLLLALCASAVFYCGVPDTLRAQESPATRDRFVELDSELQAIKEEILEINRDILLLEELSLYPGGEQLVVLVSMAGGNQFYAQRITLRLDGQTVSQHDYSDSETDALREGGVHRLYTGGLTEGEHRLEVSLSGRQARNRDFRERRGVTMNKRPGRKYMELHLGPGEKSSEPKVTIREWQQ